MRRAGLSASEDADVGLVLQDITDRVARPAVAGRIRIPVFVQIIGDLLIAVSLVGVFLIDQKDDLRVVLFYLQIVKLVLAAALSS